MDEVIITEITGWNSLQGHWHWQKNRNNRLEIMVRPPVRGERGWNCLCKEEPTHEILNDYEGTRPGKPLFNHRTW